MTATLDAVKNTATATKKNETSETDGAPELMRMAREQGLSLTGPDGLCEDADEDSYRDCAGRGNDRAPRLRNITLTTAAQHLGLWPGGVARIEQGKNRDHLTNRYRDWLNKQLVAAA